MTTPRYITHQGNPSLVYIDGGGDGGWRWMEESCTKDAVRNAVRNQLNKFIIHDHILLSLATMTKCYDYHVSLMYTSQFIDSFIVSLIS